MIFTDSKAAQTAFTTAFAVILAANLVGNTLVILIILNNRAMKTAMNYLLLNLAVADMMVGVFTSPKYIFQHAFTHPHGRTGEILCKILTGDILVWVGSSLSSFFLVVIAVERYVAVIHPYNIRHKITTNKLKVIIPCCWIGAVLLNIPLFLVVTHNQVNCEDQWPQQWMPKSYSLLWLFVAGLFPVGLMAFLYARVVHRLWFKMSPCCDASRQAVLKTRKRATKAVVTVSIIYGLCWLPNLASEVLRAFSVFQYSYNDVIHVVTIVLVGCNSSVNPYVYAIQNHNFRKHLKDFTCRNRSIHPLAASDLNLNTLSEGRTANRLTNQPGVTIESLNAQDTAF